MARSLERIWATKRGLLGWISTVDHKEIGLRYIVTAFAFLIAGGLEALVLRVQLARPNQALLTPEQYDELFSMHGITMIFLYASPVLSGFSNYLFPLVLGARDMAFPRLNAFSYWIYLAAGLFIYSSLLAAAAPNDGWFNYVPYALREYNPGPNLDFYALGMIFLGISTTVGSANFVVTFLRMRAPGMSLNLVPILTWGTTTVSVGNLLAVPSVSLAFFLLWTDRQFGTHFFRPNSGGHPLLWQHLFWMFAHPWVYVVVLPAMGLVSDSLPFFCRRPLVGYSAVVIGTVTTMALGFGVWLHHMFATGIPFLALAFFSGASFAIAIPSAIAVFAWIATIWTGRPVLTSAFLYFAGFVVMFVIGGVSGVVTASVPADLQVTDTYFVVAHIHYVLIGINLFAVLGALHVWFPKMTGRLLSETFGKWVFWVVFVGFNLAFLPMHWTGLLGMPRRIYTYPAGLGWETPNLITTAGAFVLAFGILLFLINVFMSLPQRPACGAQSMGRALARMEHALAAAALQFPRRAEDCEPPSALGVAAGRRPPSFRIARWRGLGSRQGSARDHRARRHSRRNPQDARRHAGAVHRHARHVGRFRRPPSASLVARGDWDDRDAGGSPCLALAGTRARAARRSADMTDASQRFDLPVGSIGRHANGWWGMMMLIVTEGALFVYLLFAYYYAAVQHSRDWLPADLPGFKLSLPDTIVLLLSSVVVWRGERLLKQGRSGGVAAAYLGVAALMGIVFVAVQALEWAGKKFTPFSSSYGSLYFTITGFHMLHVAAGVLILATLALWSALGYFNRIRSAPVTIGAIYWHFVDAVWLVLFFTFYITPRLGLG